jgi:hypothetical protein
VGSRFAAFKAADTECGKRNASNKKGMRETARGSSQEIIFHTTAIALVDTNNSSAAGGRRCSVSVPMHVAGLLNEFWNGKGVGGSATPAGNKLFWI